MAKGVKTGGRDFAPGQSGNLNGRPKVPPDVRQARTANTEELTRILTEFMKLPISFLKERMKAEGTSSMEMLVGSILVKAITNGDFSRANFLFDRAFGKVPDKHEFQGSVHAALVKAMKGLGEPE